MLAVKNLSRKILRITDPHQRALGSFRLASSGQPQGDPKKPASKGAMCGRQTALVFAHACGSLWGPWAQGILWTHAFLRLPWHGWGNEQGTLAAQGFHAHAAELGFSPENCDAPSLPEVFLSVKSSQKSGSFAHTEAPSSPGERWRFLL